MPKVNLGSIQLDDRKSPVYLTPEEPSLQITSRGPRYGVCKFLSMFSKGAARRVRKALREAGYPQLAGIPSDHFGDFQKSELTKPTPRR